MVFSFPLTHTHTHPMPISIIRLARLDTYNYIGIKSILMP